jgi:3-hydroxybutyryl-CoA dehydrogenase
LRLAVLGRPGLWLAARAVQSGAEVCYAELVIGARTAVPHGVEHAASIEDALRRADVSVDFVPDELESKLEILALADRMAPPPTILMTPTEACSVRDLASCTYRAERVVGLRGLAADACTLVHGPEVLPEVLASLQSFWAQLGCRVDLVLDTGPLP